MSYFVIFHKISGLVSSEVATPSLAAARRLAIDGVESKAAERAEIVDAQGRIIFEYPDDEYYLGLNKPRSG
jgi:hypothetical protein